MAFSVSGRLDSTCGAHEERMIELHQALQLLSRPPPKPILEKFSVKDISSKMRRFFPTLVSYSSDIPEGKEVSSALHRGSVSRACIRSLPTAKEIQHLWCRKAHRLAETEAAR